MKKLRYKVLKTFTGNHGGQIVAGNPDHPDEEGRILFLDPLVAKPLIDSKDIKPWSFKDEARAEVEGEDDEHEDDDEKDDDKTGTEGGANRDGARTSDIPGKAKSAQTVRNERTKPARHAKKGSTAAAPVGGHDTNASTNHGSTATNGQGVTSDTNAGANSAPSDDAP